MRAPLAAAAVVVKGLADKLLPDLVHSLEALPTLAIAAGAKPKPKRIIARRRGYRSSQLRCPVLAASLAALPRTLLTPVLLLADSQLTLDCLKHHC